MMTMMADVGAESCRRCLDLTCEEFEAAALEEAELNFAGLRDLPEPTRNLAPIGDRKVRALPYACADLVN